MPPARRADGQPPRFTRIPLTRHPGGPRPAQDRPRGQPVRRRCRSAVWFSTSAPQGSRQGRAISSAGERFVHTEEVTGSIQYRPPRSRATSHKWEWPFRSLCSSNVRQALRAEAVTQPPERVPGLLARYLAVDVRHHRDLAVTENPHRHPRNGRRAGREGRC